MTVAAAHELFHYLKDVSQTESEQLQNDIIEILKHTPGVNYEDVYKSMSELYPDATKNETEEEIACQYFGVAVNNKAYLEKVIGENPSVWEKVKRHIEEFLSEIKNAVSSFAKFDKSVDAATKSGAEQLEKMAERIDAALIEAKKNKADPSGEGRKYSIKYTTDNRPVAVIDEDILYGVKKSEWVKTIKDTMSRKFSAGIPISGRLIKVNSDTRNEYVKSKYNKHIKANDKTIYIDKLRTANNIDDIVLASTNYINEDLHHERKDTIKEFARGEVLIRVKENNYSAKVIIGFTSSKNMLLYDVIDLTPANIELRQKEKKEDVQEGYAKKQEAHESSTSSELTISQPDTESQYHSMQNEKKYSDSDKKDSKKTDEHIKNTDESVIKGLRSIGEKSINSFTSEDIQKAEKWANKFFYELGTKSPFFRAWFGDWREYDNTVVSVANTPGNVRGILKNADTGWNIQVSRMVFNETMIHSGNKIITARPYLSYINDIVEKAVLLDTYTISESKKKSANSLLMHSMYAVTDIGNGPKLLKLYVEEMNDPNRADTAKRAYQLQNIEVSSLTGEFNTISSGKALASFKTADIHTVADLFETVKRNDKKFMPKPANKTLLNSDGTPKVFYHTTHNNFTVFKKGEKSGLYGKGIYFSEQRMPYGENTMACYLKMSNPITYKETYSVDGVREVISGIKHNVISDFHDKFPQYDGIIGRDEVVVFEPEQIKSATDNIGTFDRNNSDIRFSKKILTQTNADIQNLTDQEKTLRDMNEAMQFVIDNLRNSIENAEEKNKNLERKLYNQELNQKVTNGRMPYDSELKTIAAKYNNSASDITNDDLFFMLKGIMGGIADGTMGSNDVITELNAIASRIIESSDRINNEDYNKFKEFRLHYHSGRFYVNDSVYKQLCEEYGGAKGLRRATLGKLNIHNYANDTSGTSLTDDYNDVSQNAFSELMQKDIDEYHIVDEILSCWDTIKPKFYDSELQNINLEEAAMFTAEEMLHDMIQARTKTTVADKNQYSILTSKILIK